MRVGGSGLRAEGLRDQDEDTVLFYVGPAGPSSGFRVHPNPPNSDSNPKTLNLKPRNQLQLQPQNERTFPAKEANT